MSDKYNKNVSLGEQSELSHTEETLACFHSLGFRVIQRFFCWTWRRYVDLKKLSALLVVVENNMQYSCLYGQGTGKVACLGLELWVLCYVRY